MPYLLCFVGIALISVPFLYPKGSGKKFCPKIFSVLTILSGFFTVIFGIISTIQKTVYSIPLVCLYIILFFLSGSFFAIRLNKNQTPISIVFEIASAILLICAIVLILCGIQNEIEFISFPYIALYGAMAFLAFPSEVRADKQSKE